MFDNYEWFKAKILEMTQIDLNAYKERQMKRRIESMIKKNGILSYNDYIRLLTQENDKLEEFLCHITINVSEFYRNPNQWRVMEETIIPHLIKKRGSQLKIWSSACSTGEEPYTVVMLLKKHYPNVLPYVEVIATDIDKQALKQANYGVYHIKNLKNLPEDMLRNYFEPLDNHMYRISDEVKSHVKFKWHNLLFDEYPKYNDLILCRNVLIYFTDTTKKKIYHNFSCSQPKDGVLFIGSTEQLMRPENYGYDSFCPFYYIKK